MFVSCFLVFKYYVSFVNRFVKSTKKDPREHRELGFAFEELRLCLRGAQALPSTMARSAMRT